MAYTVLAEVLGIDEPEDDAELVAITRKGLPSNTVDLLAARLEISTEDLSAFLHISRRTIDRNRGKILGADTTDRVLAVAKVYSRCMDVFGTDERCVRWLKAPVLALGDARPIDLLDTSAGKDMIMDILGRIEHGVFS